MDNRPLSFLHEDLLVRKGNQLHEIMLLLLGFYGVVYTIINFYTGQWSEMYFVIPVIPGVSIAYLLYAKGYPLISKIFNLIQVIFSIGGLCLMTSPKTFILSFFIPIFIGTLIVFQGRERKVGYFFTGFTFLVFIFLLTTDYHIGPPLVEDEAEIRREWYINMIGAIAFSLLQIIFILRLSNTIQNSLLESRENLETANGQLKAAIDTRDKMISILSHDLRSPLLLMSSGLELLRPSKLPAAMSEKLIGDLTTRVKQTISMVDNLLLWSKRQADVVQYEPQPLKIAAIRKIISDYAELMLNAKAITFRIEGEEEGIVAADKDMLEAILRNLLSNAFKFTPVNGEVVVQIAKEKQGYRFSIKDNGMGMSAEQVQKLSSGSSFTRLGTALEKGHGIGMQLVRDFIERHGATLEILSEEAQGTTFSFVLKEVSTNLQ